MNEKGKETIMPSAGLHGPLHMATMCAHTHWYCLLLLGRRDRGVHVLKCILLTYSP